VANAGGKLEINENAVYTIKEAEELLQVSTSTMMRLIKKGLIGAAKVGKQYRILGKELLRVVSPKLEDKVGKAYNKARNWVHEGVDDETGEKTDK
jgi:excisionase family DNA binding protein